MNTHHARRAAVLGALFFAGAATGFGDEAPAELAGPRHAFAKMKMLEGVWDEAEYGRVVRYHLTGRGSALVEEFIGDPPMMSVYHLDGDDLRLTHYCNAGNQPRMIADDYAGEGIGFGFVDVTNLEAPDAYHTRTLDVEFIDADRVVLRFTGLKEGREIATTHTLTRRGGSAAAAPECCAAAIGGYPQAIRGRR